ncbi:MAG: glucosyl-3-phosphoglycerate synthase [Actinobacteria bacterium]|nr:glucosyl-3-phosphoglycerate synthase [Actinomycetota bacterium]
MQATEKARPHLHERREAPRDWFASRSFPASAFADVEALAARKQRLGLSISLILPTLNVADTLPQVLAEVAAVSAGATALIDQVIVVDGASSDATVEIARQAGAEVYLQDSLLPNLGPALGKGDAMWRALARAGGDIIVFADTDTRNFHRDFVTATLGPLIVEPEIRFSKAAFRRPFTGESKDITADGGGRVTELTAKPLFNVFFPQLAGFAQPLAGEFAGTRELLFSIPFFTGYGVETGLLIDTLGLAGLSAMAQVDVGVRVNRHQSLGDLGRMSYAVLRTVLRRATGPEARHNGCCHPDLVANGLYSHAVMTADGFRLYEYAEELIERPPMAELRAA